MVCSWLWSFQWLRNVVSRGAKEILGKKPGHFYCSSRARYLLSPLNIWFLELKILVYWGIYRWIDRPQALRSAARVNDGFPARSRRLHGRIHCLITALFAIIGNNYYIYYRFKGGAGIQHGWEADLEDSLMGSVFLPYLSNCLEDHTKISIPQID